jgi:arabinan endo-1,5-alpha-L-arabinosidase
MKFKTLLSTILAGCMMITGAFSGNIQPTDSSAVVNKARVSVHDPSVLKDSNGTYYIFGSHIDAAKSNDLQNWYTFTNGYTPVNNKIFGNLSQNLSKAR